MFGLIFIQKFVFSIGLIVKRRKEMRVDYYFYMAEKNGMDQLISTRQSRINAAINDFIAAIKAGYNINDTDLQNKILSSHNLKTLSSFERTMIAKEVGRRI